ncbi:hypothetical protein [Limimaricola soesokkakensis]|uniref:hypothetical protein n=1 Tax=Limimaricola soesokkakensis TaxID=1343159 RepID=UPI0035143C01
MAAIAEKHPRVFLEKGCEFTLKHRGGTVVELRPEGYLIRWDEHVDKDGVCHESAMGMMSYKDIAVENDYGTLRIVKRPQASTPRPGGVSRVQRTKREIARMQLKRAYVQVANALIKKGELRNIRDDFEKLEDRIAAEGEVRHRRMLRAAEGRKQRSMALKAAPGGKTREVFEYPAPNGRTFFKWYRTWQKQGDEGLFDDYRKCGGASRYFGELRAFVGEQIQSLLDMDRTHFGAIAVGVQAAIQKENARREQLPVPQGKLEMPGYGYIRNRILDIAPFDHAIRSRGFDVAYRDLHAVGVGVKTSRALERVEIDEYTVDLMVLMKDTPFFDDLSKSEKLFIGLNGKPQRVTLFAAIDVHTRCLLALQIVPEKHENILRSTVELIYLDKTSISDAAGCECRWEQFGAPEEIVLDRGAKYVSNEAYEILAALGITNLGAPAGKPWLKPYIERVFRTLHSDLLARLPGRTFSNVVAKGENDPERRASLKLEDFLFWLVRWVVDAYHTKHHAALGMTPAQAWNLAVMQSAPRAITSSEMRLAFGTRVPRKPTRTGIRAMYIDYQSEALMTLCLGQRMQDIEVAWWPGDVGAIEVRIGNGEWLTVPAADKDWIGKTDVDLIAWLSAQEDTDAAARETRLRTISLINEMSGQLKMLRKLVAQQRTPEELLRTEAKFARHVVTAERQHAYGDYEDILAGTIEADDLSEAEFGPDEPTTPAADIPPDQLME